MHKILFYCKFIIRLYMFQALCAHHSEVKIVLYSIWYHHTCRWPSGAPGWTVRDRIPVGTRFSAHPDRPWGPPNLLYNGHRVYPGGKVRPGRTADHSPPSSAAVIEE